MTKEVSNEYTGTELKDGAFREESEVDEDYTDDDTPADETREIVTKDGDNIIALAREHLSDSSRYKEITRLNPTLTTGFLPAGVKVKLPPTKPTFGKYIEQVAIEHGLQGDPALQDANHPKSQDVVAEARRRHRAHLAHAAENEKRRAAYEKK